MNTDLLNEIIHELRRQNVLIEQLVKKQKESVGYLWLIAIIMVISAVLPLLIFGFGASR